MRRFGGDSRAVRDVFEVDPIDQEEFGYEPDGPVPEHQGNNNVQVPSIRCPLTAAGLHDLQREVAATGTLPKLRHFSLSRCSSIRECHTGGILDQSSVQRTQRAEGRAPRSSTQTSSSKTVQRTQRA